MEGSRFIIKDLEAQYLAKGGTKEYLASLPFGFSLKKEAKLREAIRQLDRGYVVPQKEVAAESKEEQRQVHVDLISDYPPELHSTYLDRKRHFLEACSLKMQLNALSAANEKEAFALQWQIWKLFELVDNASEKLAYWRKNKRILNDSVSEDFSKLSQTELVQRRNTLRSNASNRAKTILKMEEQLASADSSKKLRVEDKLLKKREALRKIHLQIAKLDDMIK